MCKIKFVEVGTSSHIFEREYKTKEADAGVLFMAKEVGFIYGKGSHHVLGG